ncbi:GH17846 [Drosophila grimshawi]|uniref:GH17846 n=2 Tax=Drosophila grimshawi TaxID=7222 RepID=B4JWY2_DROGR|nr:GH17846 [Drosophila grimshawi]
MQKLWLQFRRIAYSIMCELGGKELVEAAASWCLQHPDIAICAVAACFVLFLPLLIIFGFGIITMAVTFTGILVLEGTVLTVILIIFLACIASLTIGVVLFAVIAYFGFAQIYEFFGMERHRDALITFMQQNRSSVNASGPARNATETGSAN